MEKKKFKYLLEPQFYEKFFESAIRIVDFDTGKVVPFKLNPIQRRFLYNWDENSLILKARRHGISTLLLAVAFTNCLYFDNYKAAFIAHNKDDAREIFKKVKFFLDNLPKELNVQTDTASKDELSFIDTGSQITVSTAGTKAAKSGADLTFIHFSEVAKFEAFDILTSAREALLTGGVTFYESTAKGMNKFYDMWETAQGFFQTPKKSYIKPFFFSAAEHPSYRRDLEKDFKLTIEEKEQFKLIKDQCASILDEDILKHLAWRRWKVLTMDDPSLLPQEHPLTAREAFISSGNPVFNLNQLDRMKNASRDYRLGNLSLTKKGQIGFFDEKGGYIRIFLPPEPGKQYVIGNDVAEGKQGGDNSAGVVLDAQTKEQAAEFHGSLDPDIFAYQLNMLGRFYNDALLAVEMNGPGHSVNSMLCNKYDYPRLYQEEVEDSDMTSEITGSIGFRTNKSSKQELITLTKRAIRLGSVKINSVPCIMECRAFITNKTGTAEAEKGKHDDLVMALMIAIFCLEHMPELAQRYFPNEGMSAYYDYIQKPVQPRSRKRSGY